MWFNLICPLLVYLKIVDLNFISLTVHGSTASLVSTASSLAAGAGSEERQAHEVSIKLDIIHSNLFEPSTYLLVIQSTNAHGTVQTRPSDTYHYVACYYFEGSIRFVLERQFIARDLSPFCRRIHYKINTQNKLIDPSRGVSLKSTINMQLDYKTLNCICQNKTRLSSANVTHNHVYKNQEKLNLQPTKSKLTKCK